MALTILAAVALGSVAAAYAAFEARQFTETLRSLELRGSNIVMFEAADPHDDVRVSRASCEALVRVPGVTRAGLIVDDGTKDFPELGARTAVYSASATLFAGLSSHDGLIGAAAGASDSAYRTVTFGAGDVRRLARIERQPEGIPINAAVVVPLAPGTDSAAQCLVELARFQDVTAAVPTLASQLTVRDGPIDGRPRLRPTTDPMVGWASRPGQGLAVALGAAGGVLTVTMIGRRSRELAAYRLSGTGRWALALLLAVECSLAAGAFALSGILAASLFAAELISVSEQIAWLMAGAAAWCIAAMFGAAAAVRISPAALARSG